MARRLFLYSYASARSRALAAGLLKPAQIDDLLDTASGPEAERWLEKKLDLAGAGSEIGLHARFLAFGGRIARSLPSAARSLVLAYLSRARVENLKLLCRGLLTGRRQEESPYLLASGQGKSVWQDASGARTLEELSGRLPRGPYRASIRSALKAPEEERLFLLECGLDRTFWDEVVDRAGRLPWFDRLAALEILGMRADVDRYRVIGRSLQAELPAEVILSSLPPLGTLLPSKRVRIALVSDNPASSLERLLGAVAEEPLERQVEPLLFRRLFRHLRRTLVSPPLDVSVPLSALLLMELETRDLKSILGGKRFGIGKEDMIPILSCYGA